MMRSRSSMRIWNCCSDWCKNMENELSKESDSVGLFAYCKIKYLKLHLKWTIIPAEDVVLRRRHALITVGSGYGSDGNADRCIAVIARDTDSNFCGVLRHRPKKGPMCLRSRLMGRCLRPFILPIDDCLNTQSFFVIETRDNSLLCYHK